jgi:hypothetical protein
MNRVFHSINNNETTQSSNENGNSELGLEIKLFSNHIWYFYAHEKIRDHDFS